MSTGVPTKGTPAPPDAFSAYELELNAGADRIREAAKWLVASFGAIAGALLVGVQLSDIGKLEGERQAIAAAAALIGFGAAIVIVALASLVLARGRPPLADLAAGRGRRYRRLIEELERNRTLFASYDSIAQLIDEVETQLAKQVRSDREMASDDPAVRARAARELEKTRKRMPSLNQLNRRLMTTARAEDTRLTFDLVRWWIVAMAVAVATCAAAFVFVDRPPQASGTSSSALAPRPVAARLSLDRLGREKLREALGPACPLSHAPVMVLASSDSGWDLVSIPATGCRAAHLQVETEDGELEAVERVALMRAPSPR